jgi:hypothetical protein
VRELRRDFIAAILDDLPYALNGGSQLMVEKPLAFGWGN